MKSTLLVCVMFTVLISLLGMKTLGGDDIGHSLEATQDEKTLEKKALEKLKKGDKVRRKLLHQQTCSA